MSSVEDLPTIFRAPYKTPPRLAPGWVVKESRSKHGRIFYMNKQTRETTWTMPVAVKPLAFVAGVQCARPGFG